MGEAEQEKAREQVYIKNGGGLGDVCVCVCVCMCVCVFCAFLCFCMSKRGFRIG